MPKRKDLTVDDLDIGEHNVGQAATNPLYASIFNQPAKVNKQDELCVIPIEQLYDFPNHPFKVRKDQEMVDLRDSISDNGVLEPIIVRPRQEGGYTILAGHRRKVASELAQLSSIPALVKYNLTDDQAIIIMVDSNKQRENILPSERAFALKMKMDAIKRQSGRKSKESLEKNGAPEEPHLKSSQLLAQEEGVGAATVKRYIRLTYLIPQLLDLVDNDVIGDKSLPTMALKPAVEISYLQPNEQKYFYDTVKTLNKTPSVQQAAQIKQLSAKRELTQTQVMAILVQEKPNQRETVKVDSNRLCGYFKESYTPREYETKVFERLDGYDKITKEIKKYIKGKELTDDEMATLAGNAIKSYISKSREQKNIR